MYNKFGGKRVVDDKGVSWIEVPLKKEWGNMPVEAFSMIPFVGSAGNLLKKIKEKLNKMGTETYVREENQDQTSLQQEKEKPIIDPKRNIQINNDEVEVLRKVLFGEISNRNSEKKELEARVILNTVLNRVKNNKDKNKPYDSMLKVLSQNNQYQAYGDKQFGIYDNPKDYPTKQKKDEINKIIDKLLEEIKNGTFQDNTNGAFYYIHNPDGSITFDSKRKLYE